MKTWFITGCSAGLGKSLARAVLKKGYRAAITARNPETLQEFAQDFPETALRLPLDVTAPKAIQQAVKTTLKWFGGIDVLVNNAVQFAETVRKIRRAEYAAWQSFSGQSDFSGNMAVTGRGQVLFA